MKSSLFIICLAFATFMNAQDSIKTESLNLNDLKISVTLENFEELKKFDVEEFREVFSEVKKDKKIEFSLKYIYPKTVNSTEKEKSISYKLEGNSSEIEKFVNGINQIQKVAVRVASRE